MKVLLVVYDNDSYIHWFPQGLAYLASVLRNRGYSVDVYKQDLNHWPEEHLTAYLNKSAYDVVALSFIGGYYQYKKALLISEAINRAKNRPIYIIGGHGPSPEPEFFLKKTGADVVVRGEGEVTICELFDAYAAKRSIVDIKGIAFLQGDQAVITEDRPLIEDIDTIPFPAYDLFPIEHYRLMRKPHASTSDFLMPVLSGRGCPFTCTFCYRMDKGFRPRSNAAIIEEISLLQKDYGITYIDFSDELLMSSVKRTTSLCEDLIAAGLKIRWSCNGRLNYAKPELLRLMKEAGCRFINYGIEAMDNDVLQRMNKSLTTKQIVDGIEATLAQDISPGFNILFGNVGDNKKTLQKGVDFLLKYDSGAQMRTIRPVTPYPGSPLYDFAIESGLLQGCQDFYDNLHVNSDLLSVNFTELSDEDFHQALHDANKILLENYFKKKSASLGVQLRELYSKKDTSFRGFRQT